MNTLKMITEIKTTCATLESEKADLMARVKLIDDKLTGYRMAIESLEMTMSEPEKPKIEPVDVSVPGKYGRRTVIEFNGKRQTITEWAREKKITPECIQYRLENGWSVEDTLTKPKAPGVTNINRKKQAPKPKKVFKYDKHDNVLRQYFGIADAAKELKLSATVVEKTLTLTKDDQLRSHPDYYIAYA